PNTTPFAAGRFRHQAKLVLAGNGGGVHLDELAIGVESALLVQSGLCGSCTDDRVGGLAKDCPVAASADDDRVSREGACLHGAKIHGGDATANALCIQNGGEKLPAFVLGDLTLRLVAANLFVQRIKELLPGGGACERGAVEERSSEASEVEQALRGAVEWHAHPVEQVNDGRTLFTHLLDWGLVGEEVAAVDGVVEVGPGAVAFALEVLGGVDAALRADRVRTLHGNDGEKINGTASLGDLDNGREPRQAAAYNDDAWCCCCHEFLVLNAICVSDRTAVAGCTYRTSPGCCGLVLPGGGVWGAGKAIPA